MVAHEHWTPSKTCESPPSTQTWTTSKSFKTWVSHVWSPTPKPSKHACFTQLSRCFGTTGKEGLQPCASIWPRQTKPVYPGHHLDPGHWSGHWTQIIHWTLVTSPQSQDIGHWSLGTRPWTLVTRHCLSFSGTLWTWSHRDHFLTISPPPLFQFGFKRWNNVPHHNSLEAIKNTFCSAATL